MSNKRIPLVIVINGVPVDDKRMIFICRNCGAHMAHSIGEMLLTSEREPWAPNLCPPCGKYPPEDMWGWMTSIFGRLKIRRSGGHGRALTHAYKTTCSAATTTTNRRWG